MARPYRSSSASRRGCLLVMIVLFALAAGHAQAAVLGHVIPTLVSVNPSCTDPHYVYLVGATWTTNDESSRDFITAVIYDGAQHPLGVRQIGLTQSQIPVTIDIDYVLSSRITARPIFVRLFDTTLPLPDNSLASLRHAVESPIIANISHDPAADAAACLTVAEGPEIRLESTVSGPMTSTSIAPTIVDQVTVVTPAASRIFVMYTAECAVDASSATFLGVTLEVDGVPAEPTNAGNAFCAGTGSGAIDEFVSARVLGVAYVDPGVHSVNVVADLSGFGGSSEWRLDDRSLVVTVPEPHVDFATLGSSCLLLVGLAVSRFSRGRKRTWVRGGLRDAATVACVLVSIWIPPASAETHFSVESNESPQLFADDVARNLEVSPGQFGVAIVAVESLRVQITVTAECQVLATDAGTWMAIEILLDGSALPPTDSSFAFCTSDGTGAGGWKSASVSAVTDIDLPAAAHSVAIRARLRSWDPGETGRIDDLNLVVMEIPNP